MFLSSGCFVVSNAGNSAGSNTVEYLVLAGGGGASGDRSGGGGVEDLEQITHSTFSRDGGLSVSAQTYYYYSRCRRFASLHWWWR